MEHSDSDSFHDARGPRSLNNNNSNNNNDQSRTNSLMSETSSQPDIHPFYKVNSNYFFLPFYKVNSQNFFLSILQVKLQKLYFLFHYALSLNPLKSN